MKTAVLGTGLMGAPMAANLLAAGHEVSVWNRSRAKAEPLAAQGAHVADTASEAVSKAEIVISMLTDGRATAEILSDAALRAHLQQDAIWVEMASVKPDEARAQASDLAGLGVAHLDAPVSGGTRGAADGTLAIMVGGDPAVFDRATPALRAMGRPVRVGPSGSGQLAKLANQAIVGNAIAAVAEAMLLLDAGGADPAAVRLALKGGFADSTILQQHGARMTDGDFTPGGLSSVQFKDLNNILDEAAALGLTLPATHAVRARYERLCTDLGAADLDHAALFLELLDQNKTNDSG